MFVVENVALLPIIMIIIPGNRNFSYFKNIRAFEKVFKKDANKIIFTLPPFFVSIMKFNTIKVASSVKKIYNMDSKPYPAEFNNRGTKRKIIKFKKLAPIYIIHNLIVYFR